MRTNNKAVRTLPPDVYDALELSALAFGGIGAGQNAENVSQQGYEPTAIPICIIGHAYGLLGKPEDCWNAPALHALRLAGITISVNDPAVVTALQRLNRPVTGRVTFKQWCKELGVVRGV
jgi:hypothetical protein